MAESQKTGSAVKEKSEPYTSSSDEVDSNDSECEHPGATTESRKLSMSRRFTAKQKAILSAYYRTGMKGVGTTFIPCSKGDWSTNRPSEGV